MPMGGLPLKQVGRNGQNSPEVSTRPAKGCDDNDGHGIDMANGGCVGPRPTNRLVTSV